MANYANIKNFDIANGNGISVSIYFSGCDADPKCRGCFNSEIWSPETGKLFTNETLKEVIKLMSNPHIDHLSVIGGEPLAEYNIQAVFKLCAAIKTRFPEKKIWLWSHYLWEDLMNNHPAKMLIINFVDILVDGRFIEEEKDLTLKWRGSKNQRVIDVQKSIHNNKIVLFKD